MLGVLTGFAIIGSVIGLGYFVERSNALPEGAGRTLNRFSFFVAAPALLFVVLSEADVKLLFSGFLMVALLSALAAIVLYVVISAIWFRQSVVRTTLGALASSMVNSNNIGIPVAVYVLGGADYAAPVLLMQLILITPFSLAVLDISVRGKLSLRNILLQPVRNPIILGSLAGFAVSVFGLQLPDAVMEPFRLVGGAAVPVILIAFGMSLRGQRPFQARDERIPVITATLIKLIAMPVAAYLIAYFGFGLVEHELYAAVIMAALPGAQNVYNYAVAFDRAVVPIRDITLATTVCSLPVLLLVAWLLT